MIKVYFADDNHLMLSKLRSVIDWEKNGFSLIGQADNGEQVLSDIINLKPDIVFLDIEMPKKSGLEIISYLKNINMLPYILVLSNYDNYDYVRYALINGAKDYLLKHKLDENIILNKLNEYIKNKKDTDITRIKEEFFHHTAKQNTIRKVVLSKKLNDIELNFLNNEFDCSTKTVACVFFSINNFLSYSYLNENYDSDKISQSIITLCENIFISLNNGFISHINNGDFIIFFSFTDTHSVLKIQNSIQNMIRLITSNIFKILNIIINCSEYQIINDINIISSLYKKYIYSDNNIIIDEKEIENFIIKKQKQDLENYFNSICNDYDNLSHIEKDKVILSLLKIANNIKTSLNIFISIQYYDKLKNNIFNERDFNKTIEHIYNFYLTLMEKSESIQISNYSTLVKNAINMIYNDYSKYDISLAEVSSKLNVSSEHLSRQFKKETSNSFINFLNNYRIELSKELIFKGDLKLKQIAESVGFQDYNYFLKVFKEKTGNTPKEFISNISKS